MGWGRTLPTVAIGMMLAGCGTSVPGSATAPSSVVPLDTGAFATSARVVDGPSPRMGSVLEGRRLAETMPLFTDIDPSLTADAQFFAGPLTDSSRGGSLAVAFGLPVDEAMAKRGPGYLARVDTPGRDPKVVFLAVWEMPDAAAATAAVADPRIVAPGSSGPKKRVSIPGHPTAVAYDGGPSITALLASGRFVLGSYSALPATAVQRFFDRQLAGLRDFRPTPTDQLHTLPVDRDGVAALTLVETESDDPNADGWIAPRTAALGSTEPITTLRAVTAAGVDVVGRGRTTVWRARDSAAATTLRDALSEAQTPRGTDINHTAVPVPGVPGATCITAADLAVARTYCYLATGRYVATLTSRQPGEAAQATAAQYLVLRGL